MVSVASFQRQGTSWPCRCTPPIQRSIPLCATWSAVPASTLAPHVGQAQTGFAGRPDGSRDRVAAMGSGLVPSDPSSRRTRCHPGTGAFALLRNGRTPSPPRWRRLRPRPGSAAPSATDRREWTDTPCRADRTPRPGTATHSTAGAAGVSWAHAFVAGSSRSCSAVSLPRPPKRAKPGCSPMQIRVMRCAGTPSRRG